MFASRVAILLFALFFSVLATLAAPLEVDPAEAAPEVDGQLEKRLTHSGRGTWFEVGLGNCGHTNVDSDPIIAMSKTFYDNNNAVNCGQWVHIKNTGNGKSAYGYIADSCPGCGYYDLDMSPSLFEQLGTLDQGVLAISWNFMGKGWKPS